MKKTVSVEDVCGLLNDMLKKDPECVKKLFDVHVECNKDIMDHPTVQVRFYPGDEKPSVGFIGILNGMFCEDGDMYGSLCMEYDPDEDKILSFRPTSEEERNGKN